MTTENMLNAIDKRIEKIELAIPLSSDERLRIGLCKGSLRFKLILDAHIDIFNQGNKTIDDLVFNCLSEGIEIGCLITTNENEGGKDEDNI